MRGPGPSRRFLHDQLDDPHALVLAQRRALAGRPARHEEVNACIDLPLRQPPNARLIDIAVLVERRYERKYRNLSTSAASFNASLSWQPSAGSSQLTAVSFVRRFRASLFMVNHPCRPRIHFAASSAAGERGSVSCGVRQRDRFSCRVEPEGVGPRDEAGPGGGHIHRLSARACHHRLQRERAVPDGASFLAE